MEGSSWIALGVLIALTLVAASSGALFKPGLWYADLNKPGWVPPNWAFPVVWGVLYACVTIAAFLVWQSAGMAALTALIVHVVSLALNGAWSWLFFGLRRMDLALIDVVLLGVSVAAVMGLFWSHRPLAGMLIAPYLVWVTIAGALNLRMIQLNPQASQGGP